jgi:alkanesulfonate monooxygenase SsuD/methylene tetrahydromethanopterin reductase-like flavin-dependent oxidoreductase (luciferase family)
MQIGVALGTVDAASGHPVRLAEVAAQAVEAERLGYSSAWVMDHLFLVRDGDRAGAHDPFVTLAYLAACTSRITIGVLVAAAPFRHPGQLARESAAVADAAPGRFILGLGAGWHEPEFTAFDLPFDRRVARLDEYLRIVKALLTAGEFSGAGDFYRLREAVTLSTAPPPPIWVAAFKPRMQSLTARLADGWNAAWLPPDTGRFRELKSVIDDAQSRVRRERPLTISAGIQVEAATDIAAALANYESAGAEHVILNFGPRPFVSFDAEALKRAFS